MFFLFKPDNVVMNTIEATSQLGGFNQHLPTRQPNKRFPYSGPHRHEDDTIGNFLSSVRAQNVTTTIELIVANTLLTDVYSI